MPQVSPTEIKEIIASYTDTSAVKNIQSGGFRIAGEKYMTIKADEKSVYGKKVHEDYSKEILNENADCRDIAGKGGCGNSQNATSCSCHALPRDCTTRTGDEYRGTTG